MKGNHLNFLHIIIGIFIVGFLAIGALLYIDETKKESSSIERRGEKRERRSEFESAASINDFLTKAGNIKCELDDEDEMTTVYISDGMVRADMTGDDDDENAGLIYTNDTFYVWNTKSMKGVTGQVPERFTKLLNKETEKISEDDVEDIMENINERINSCKESMIPDSSFTPPDNISFTNL